MLVRRSLLSCARVRRAAVAEVTRADVEPVAPAKERQARSEALFVHFDKIFPKSLMQKHGIFRWNNLMTSSIYECIMVFVTAFGLGLFLWSLFSSMKYDVVRLEHPSIQAARDEKKEAAAKTAAAKVEAAAAKAAPAPLVVAAEDTPVKHSPITLKEKAPKIAP